MRLDLEDALAEVVAAEPPLRQLVVPLQRGQIRSPAQALSNVTLQWRHIRGSRAVRSRLGFVRGSPVEGMELGPSKVIGPKLHTARRTSWWRHPFRN